jgi:uncharacterized repeat protein (TIGR03803 family)
MSIAAQAASPTKTVLYNFTGEDGDGANPFASAAVSSGGVLYGTTFYGGTSGYGTVFALTPPAQSGPWTESVLYSFSGGADGANPYAGLTVGSGGTLYGATTYGGRGGVGTVFMLTPPAPGGAWTESVLFSFTGSDGANPYASLALATNGVLYGVTSLGGTSDAGAIFMLTPPGISGGAWTEAVLYNFTDGADGGFPYGGLTLASNGVLYGTTNFGGASSVYGTVFKLVPPASGGDWTLTTLHSFSGVDGGNPFAPMVITSNGVLYGTTAGGVGASFGTVFKLTPPTSGSVWTEAVLYRFSGGSVGGHPRGAVSVGPGGVLYGTTTAGGNETGYSGNGTLFQLTPPTESGGAWTPSVLHTFTGGADGAYPNGALVPTASGTYYATTLSGGANGNGTVFSLIP